MPLQPLTVHGTSFRDGFGRDVMLRGVNLGGDCKLPYPHGGTNFPSDFADHRSVSFIGRPFPLDEADEHLSRLRHWGFNVLRLLTTWEAIEHAGPGRRDKAYLDYLAEICRKAGDYGLYVFIDPHEDAWSRMTGGSGAPGWTFEAVGLDFTRFHAAGLSHVMQSKYDYARGGRQDGYPQMTWGSNHRLSPGAIMWTLFFTGKTFTPDFTIDGVNVQDYLQSHYLGSLRAVAERVRTLPNVLGFDTLNEPVPGFVGRPLSYRHLGPTDTQPSNPRLGLAMSPLDSLAAARGLPVSVPRILRDPRTGAFSIGPDEVVNPDGVSIWLEGRACPFEEAGAYRLRGTRVEPLDERFFQVRDGRRRDAAGDAYGPFFRAVAATVREVNPDWLIFAEIEPYSAFVGGPFPDAMPAGSVNASHWYDSSTLYTKTFDAEQAFDFNTGRTLHGREAIKASYVKQLRDVAALADSFTPKGAPTLIGEFGIPFDLDEGAAYAAWRDGDRGDRPWRPHVDALTLMYEAFDELKLHATLWNYTASNRNDLAVGDGWNQEDLSIFSRDQQDPDADAPSGGRAVAGFCRPFVRFAQGRLIEMSFDARSCRLRVEIDVDGTIDADSEIYLPRLHFGPEPTIEVTAGRAVVERDASRQCALVRGEGGRLRITVQGPGTR